MRIYPSKYIVPVISAMFLVSFASQHLLAGAMRESMFSYYIFLSISMIILTTFYLQIAPTFLYVLTKRKREILLKIESLQAAEPVEESQEPEVSTSSPTTAAVENDFLQKLSKRELEVVDLIAQGYTNADIAKTLYISAHTVNDHTKNIYRKLDVHSRYELIALLNQNKNGGA